MSAFEREVLVFLPEPLAKRPFVLPLRADQDRLSADEVLEWAREHAGVCPGALRVAANFGSRSELLPGDHVRLDWASTGLLGGKGGFGAGLRAMGKTAAAKKDKLNTDFSLCRDLEGRRLGAANLALLIERAKAEGKVEADAWALEKPSWVEVRRRGAQKDEKKAKRRLAEAAASANKTSSSSSSAATGDSLLAKYEMSVSHELEMRDDSVASSVAAGMKRIKVAAGEESKRVASSTAASSPILPAGCRLVSGKASVTVRRGGVYTIVGLSSFATVAFDQLPLGCEVILLTSGLVQVGYAQDGSLNEGMEAELDGVGDVKGSVAFDHTRSLFWKDGTPVTAEGQEESVFPEHDESEPVKVAFHLESADRVVFCIGEDTEISIPFSVDASTASAVPVVSLEEGERVEFRFIKPEEVCTKSSSEKSEATGETTTEPAPTIESLMALGPEKLKEELRSLGLKFGGAPLERAKRLLIAKTTPREDWPASLFPS